MSYPVTPTLSVEAAQFNVTCSGVQVTRTVRLVGVVGACGSDGGVVPPIAAVRGAYHLSAILTMPVSLGCTPSPVSLLAFQPVHWSTTVIGDWAVVFAAAQPGIALLSATVRAG